MPGEFEPIEAVWLARPRNHETWPGCLDRAVAQWEAFRAALAERVAVRVVNEELGVEPNDAWVRDYGPIFVVDDRGGLACHDFVFNGWGGKYGDEYGIDDRVPRALAAQLDIRCDVHDLVLEGGSIDVNGAGTVMTTEQCLLDAGRNAGMDRASIEATLHETLGTRHIVWLPGGIEGDDTDGHIDDVARFIAPTAVVAARAPDGHSDHAVLERNFAFLRDAADQDGEALELFELPVPEPIHYDYPADRFGPGGKLACPASYANFLIVNEAVFFPVFGQARDKEAIRAIARAMPGREIVPIRSEWLVVGLGALHCLSMQQPRRVVRG